MDAFVTVKKRYYFFLVFHEIGEKSGLVCTGKPAKPKIDG